VEVHAVVDHEVVPGVLSKREQDLVARIEKASITAEVDRSPIAFGWSMKGGCP
jgi:hypothetical protein